MTPGFQAQDGVVGRKLPERLLDLPLNRKPSQTGRAVPKADLGRPGRDLEGQSMSGAPDVSVFGVRRYLSLTCLCGTFVTNIGTVMVPLRRLEGQYRYGAATGSPHQQAGAYRDQSG